MTGRTTAIGMVNWSVRERFRATFNVAPRMQDNFRDPSVPPSFTEFQAHMAAIRADPEKMAKIKATIELYRKTHATNPA
jgi:hypothetical protein